MGGWVGESFTFSAFTRMCPLQNIERGQNSGRSRQTWIGGWVGGWVGRGERGGSKELL